MEKTEALRRLLSERLWPASEIKGWLSLALRGFSLGEYAALVSAGCLALEDAFPLIQLRADAMQSAVPVGQGAMAAAG